MLRHPHLADRWPVEFLDDAEDGPIPPRSAVVADDLTERELTVLRWMTTPMSVAEIADELGVSINTVKTHISALDRKRGAGRRREAVMAARERRLI